MSENREYTGCSGIHLTPNQDITLGDVVVKEGQTVNLSLDADGHITKVEFI